MVPLFKVYMSDKIKDEIVKTLYSGYIAQGPRVEEFEFHLKNFLDVPRILSVNAGTHALQLACHLAGVKGKKVISTPMTCSATNTAIMAAGGDIVWADVDPTTGNISPESIEDRLKHHKDIAAIMMVHWGGYPCDIDEINALGQKYGVKVIEDAAHAFGATYKDSRIGMLSDFTCFSFQAIKHLTTIDGGALVCRDEKDHARGKLLRWFGIDRDGPRKDFRCEQDIPEAGFKYHMNDINAVVGIENLKDIDFVLGRHRQRGMYYDWSLRNTPIGLLKRESWKQSAYWIYTILVQDREHFTKYMTENDITVSQVHARNDLHTMSREFLYTAKNLPGLEQFTKHQTNIPCGWWVTDAEANKIQQVIADYKGEKYNG